MLDLGTVENRRFGEVIDDAGGQCLLDMRVRGFGSHHQKLVVLRHRDNPAADVAFVGGIDLCHGRRDDAEHLGDPQPPAMAGVYGPRPPWHDIQLMIRGPAVADVETVFRERWEDPGSLNRNPLHLLSAILHGERQVARPLGEPFPTRRSAATWLSSCADLSVRRPGYPFARNGERSIARGYTKVLGRARSMVYVEDQYLWSADVVSVFAEALRREAELRMIFVIPMFPDQDGRWSLPPNLVGRDRPCRMLSEAGGDRVAVYGLENSAGTPIYVHAKACVVDDHWACVGSDNTNRRSWTHDSELSAAFVDASPRRSARELRLSLSEEHLGAAATGRDLDDPVAWFEAFRDAAGALDAWHEVGACGPRPPGRLRKYRQPVLPAPTGMGLRASTEPSTTRTVAESASGCAGGGHELRRARHRGQTAVGRGRGDALPEPGRRPRGPGRRPRGCAGFDRRSGRLPVRGPLALLVMLITWSPSSWSDWTAGRPMPCTSWCPGIERPQQRLRSSGVSSTRGCCGSGPSSSPWPCWFGDAAGPRSG